MPSNMMRHVCSQCTPLIGFYCLINCCHKTHTIDVHDIYTQFNFAVFLQNFLWQFNPVFKDCLWFSSSTFTFESGHIRTKYILCNFNVLNSNGTILHTTHLYKSLVVFQGGCSKLMIQTSRFNSSIKLSLCITFTVLLDCIH